MTERLAYRVTEFAESIGVSRTKGYEMIARGEIESIRVGGCVRVPVASIKRWLAERTTQKNAAGKVA